MSGPIYFDRDGKPITDALEWTKLFKDDEYRRVAYDTLPGGGYLSTVWMGLDHGRGDGPPIIFETMAFPAERYNIQERYSRLDEALAGHARILAELNKASSS